jgi:DNA-binding PadR family transcriptional regulator
MSVKYALLGILCEKECHGYTLKEAFDRRVGTFWSLNYGQIYQTLERMQRDGLVESYDEPQDRRPDRRVYRATEFGHQDFQEWLRRPIPRPRVLRDELFIKLLFLERHDRTLVPHLIESQKSIYMKHMRQLTEQKLALARQPAHDGKLVTETLIDAALFHAEADVRWLAHCDQRFRAAAWYDGNGKDVRR